MFCPSCGREVNSELSYCNQCGARLGGASDPRAIPTSSFNMMLGAVIGLPFIGLAMMLGVIAALKNGMNFKDDFIFVVTFLTFLLFAIAEIACVIMLLMRVRSPKIPRPADVKKFQVGQADPRGLGSPTFEPMPVGSVTDRTTRTLDHAKVRDE